MLSIILGMAYNLSRIEKPEYMVAFNSNIESKRRLNQCLRFS